MSNICHVVLNSELKNKKKIQQIFDRLMAIFRLHIFIATWPLLAYKISHMCHIVMKFCIQPNNLPLGRF